MTGTLIRTATLAAALLVPAAAKAEPLIWGISVEQAEYRIGGGAQLFAWDFDATIGSDDLKVVWRSEAEFDLDEEAFEALENQLRVQVPVSDFFDAVAGIRVDTPEGPDRAYAVLGLHGLAQQWFEIDADFFISDHPSFRFEVEYEGLITNRLIATPSIELDLPFTDDPALDQGAFGPKLEVGLRLSYDLVDRALSPYVGVHYERSFGETSLRLRRAGEDPGAVLFVAGAKVLF